MPLVVAVTGAPSGAHGAKALVVVVADLVRVWLGVGEAAPRSLGHGMCLWGLGPREQGSSSREPTHFSRCSQGQATSWILTSEVNFPVQSFLVPLWSLGL